MSGELVPYRPKEAGPRVPCQRRRRNQEVVEEARDQLAAYLAAVSERYPDISAFTDLMTGSLEALIVKRELRVLREARERPRFEWGV